MESWILVGAECSALIMGPLAIAALIYDLWHPLREEDENEDK